MTMLNKTMISRFSETYPAPIQTWRRTHGRVWGLLAALLMPVMAPGTVWAAPPSSATVCDGSTLNANNLSVVVKAGDVFTFVSGVVVYYVDGSLMGGLASVSPLTVTPAQDGAIFRFSVDGAGEISCTTTGSSASAAPVTVQAAVMQTAINTNIADRFSGGGMQLGENRIFVSTSGMAHGDQPDWNAWIAYDMRGFSGGATGNTNNISLGIDKLLTPDLLVGGFVGREDQSMTSAGKTTDVLAPLTGLYAAKKLRDQMFLSGFAGIGHPEYRVDGDAFTATRSIIGLTLTGHTQMQGYDIQPVTQILASREEQPAHGSSAADRLDNLQIKFNGRISPQQRLANGLLPYISLGAEYRVQASQVNGTDRFLRPRVGLGFDWALTAGTLRGDVDFGSVNSSTQDFGGSLVYLVTF